MAEKQKPLRRSHRSSTDKKLYAIRDSASRFKDIAAYKRAHEADLRRKEKLSGPHHSKAD